MTRAVAATETAIKRAIKANKATGGEHVIEITKSGALLLIPLKFAQRGTAINENEFDKKKDIIL